eukprot:TRINITY_DN324_c2_g2_i1.p1 TRINITY_DN324_c2_g2~~TRINITY_DN324_c2_g2_i1.p1  ORF type:complete len:609 (+),score=185.53 TRINITY_DN324_c2_g2_i1:87-1829(+)
MDERLLQSIFPHLPPARIRMALTATCGNISLASNILLEPDDVGKPSTPHSERCKKPHEGTLVDVVEVVEVSSRDDEDLHDEVISLEDIDPIRPLPCARASRGKAGSEHMHEQTYEHMSDRVIEFADGEERGDRLFDDVLYSQFSQTSTHSIGKTSSIRSRPIERADSIEGPDSIDSEGGKQKNTRKPHLRGKMRKKMSSQLKTKKDEKEREKLIRQIEGGRYEAQEVAIYVDSSMGVMVTKMLQRYHPSVVVTNLIISGSAMMTRCRPRRMNDVEHLKSFVGRCKEIKKSFSEWKETLPDEDVISPRKWLFRDGKRVQVVTKKDVLGGSGSGSGGHHHALAEDTEPCVVVRMLGEDFIGHLKNDTVLVLGRKLRERIADPRIAIFLVLECGRQWVEREEASETRPKHPIFLDASSHGKEDQRHVTMLAYRKAILEMSIQCSLHVIESKSEEHTAQIVQSIFRIQAHRPYEKSIDACDAWKRKGNGGLQDVWLHHIASFPQVSVNIASAIVAEYPSFRSLMSCYEDSTRTEEEKDMLLANVVVSRGRRVGPKASKRIHQFYRTYDDKGLASKLDGEDSEGE